MVPSAPGPPRLFTVEEFEKMVQAKIFSDAETVQLVERQLYGWPPASVHDPVRLPRSELQPDLALLKPRSDNYFAGHPAASDVLLVVEVADTTADYDRKFKIPLYGRSGIPESWLIDLAAGLIEVYRQSNHAGYGTQITLAAGDSLAPAALSDVVLSVSEILGTSA
jgi:Uma2 family endonuclease